MLALAITACDRGPTEPEKPDPGIRLTAGANVSDTIQAVPVQALNVQIIGPDGKAAAGTPVLFESVLARVGQYQRPTMWVGSVAMSTFGTSMADTTDANGNASVRVRFGTVAGDGKVVVTAATLGYQDTARYTVQPGGAVKVVLAPRDSALYSSRSYALRGGAVDRFGNTRADAVSFSVRSGPAAVSGSQVTATGLGRALVVGQVGALSDSVFVSVVPEGTLAVLFAGQYSSDPSGVYTVNLDGSGLKRVAARASGYGFSGPDWFPDGSRLVYGEGGHEQRLYTADMQGSVTRLITSSYAIRSEAWPQVSADGGWIYYNGRPDHQNGALWRVRTDGTGAEQVGPAIDWYAVDGYASPSRDGSKLVYATNRGSNTGALRILTVATKESVPLNLIGATPRWSPAGDEIAFVSIDGFAGYIGAESLPSGTGVLKVVRSDGTGERTIPTGTKKYYPVIDWSPDGGYLVARASTGGLEVINVQTGETMPLPFSKQYLYPAWKP